MDRIVTFPLCLAVGKFVRGLRTRGRVYLRIAGGNTLSSWHLVWLPNTFRDQSFTTSYWNFSQSQSTTLLADETTHMTTPQERTRSLVFALEMLEELIRLDLYPEIPDEVTRQAQAVLRHFPNKDEIAWLAVQVERDCRYPLLAPSASDILV